MSLEVVWGSQSDLWIWGQTRGPPVHRGGQDPPVCVNGCTSLQKQLGVTQQTGELTDWTRGVCFDYAAEICDRLLQESSFPVQQVPDRQEESSQSQQHEAKCLYWLSQEEPHWVLVLFSFSLTAQVKRLVFPFESWLHAISVPFCLFTAKYVFAKMCK